jgi:quinoprotein dehydrogenase-associated probable ABC transporter substrate-binding protein
MRVCADPNHLPYSKSDQSGFDNRIAALLAEALGAELTFEWFPQNPQMFSEHLRVGNCDIIIGVQDGQATVLSTLAYYRSPFVFIQKADRPFLVNMFDDPILPTLRIGVQDAIGAPHDALRIRGMGPSIAKYFDFEVTAGVEDVAKGEVDIAVAWGPSAGYYAAQQSVPLIVSPVTPEFEPPFTPMFVNIAIGVRRGEEELQKMLDKAIAKQWDKIIAVLAEFHIPTMELQKPLLTVEGP